MSADRANKNAGQKPMGPGRGGPMGSLGMPVQKAKDFKGTLRRLILYLKPHRLNLMIVLIFAIASTIFSIAAPKVSARAMNKLQDSYMARMMLQKLSEAQQKAVDKIYEAMTEAQRKTLDTVSSQMADAQRKAADKITGSMADAQKNAVGAIEKQMADAQRKAISGIEEQMAATQKTLTAQLKQQTQQPPSPPEASPGSEAPEEAPPMSPETLQAIQDFLQLPSIDAISDPQQKAAVIVSMMDLLSKLPGASQQISAQSLAAMKSLLQLPMLDTVTDPQRKTSLTLELLEVFKNMPAAQTAQQMPPDTLEAMKELLSLPLLNTVKDSQAKTGVVLKLLNVFKKMPQSQQGSQALNPKSLDAMKDLLSLPLLDTVRDPKQKADLLLRVMDVFKRLPGTSPGTQAGQEQQITPEALDAVKELSKLPDINSIEDPRQKADTVSRMLDLFVKMPESRSNTQNTGTDNGTAKELDPETANTMKELLGLPLLGTLKDAGQKAEVCRKFIDLGQKLSAKGESSLTLQNVQQDVQLTQEQIDGAIRAIRETNGEYDFNYIGIIVLVLIGMYLVSAAFSLVMGLVMSGVAQKTVRDLRTEVDDKLSRLPLKYFDIHPHGDILSRVTNDIDTIATTLQQSLTQIITSVITIIGYILMMLTISPVLTLIVIATLPLYILATTLIAKQSQKYFAAQQKELGALSGHVEEIYTGHKIVKAFGREKASIKRFEDINGRLNSAGWKAQFVSGIMFPLMNFISNLGYVGISIVGGIWITRNLLGLGDILAFIQYSRSFTMPITQTANIANIIQSTVACAERVFEVLDEPEEIPDRQDAKILEAPKGEVAFQHVDFSYKEEEPLIRDMNLAVKPGDTIAIVGPTGAGKTTLVNLLMRFYEINSGRISIDGMDIKEIKRSELRKIFGMVLQDTWLFNGSIKDNIAYGKEGATMEEITGAAKAAHADRFIRTLPEGYNTVLNEEATNISQGQKQLLTIARAILADPAILILDEATSSVDTRTEVLIQKAMANLMQGRTSFVIAHRLSTIRDAELILVMNKGTIIEMGSHKELINKGGFYADLYNSQFTGAGTGNDAV